MNLKKILENNRGVSPLFITIYISLIIVLLISVLFTSLQTSSSAINDSIKIDVERSLEKVIIPTPKGLNLTQNGEVHTLMVKNLGSVTVRIRGLYIDSKFIMDPSTYSYDSYIDPNENITIPLWPKYNILWENVKEKIWTVVTERGTRYSAIGYEIWSGSSVWGEQPRFYFGPLMINFDEFHWRVGNGPWRDGWSIPKGTPEGSETLYWRISVMNIDNRTIIINNTSAFTLICNDKAPKDPRTWYINEDLTSMTFIPNRPNYVYYSGKTDVGSGTTYITFLTFYGNFIESDGTKKPFGQTVPFEAVLATDTKIANKVILTANPINIRNDGISESTLTAQVFDTSGRPMVGVWVNFYASDGDLLSSRSLTDGQGKATVQLRSVKSPRTVDVAAVCQGAVGKTKVVFTPAVKISLTANPIEILKGGKSTITVQLMDENGPVGGPGINITMVVLWNGRGQSPSLDKNNIVTDSNGRATVILTAGNNIGIATITASASGLQSGSTTVIVKET